MAAMPNSFVFAQIPSTAAENAFEFHRNFASKDPHVHPRIESEIAEFARSGHLFGVLVGRIRTSSSAFAT